MSLPASLRSKQCRAYLGALAACAIAAAVAAPLRLHLELSNTVMLFLLAVLLVAVRWGRGPAVVAAFVSVALFDFFFVPPRFSFAVSDIQYLITFLVMLAVALITGQLTAGLRSQAALAKHKHQQTQALYEMAKDLAGALALGQVSDILNQFLQSQLQLNATLLTPDKQGTLRAVVASDFQIDMQYALMAYEQGQVIEDNDVSAFGQGAIYFPLRSSMRVRGVFIVAAQDRRSTLHEQKPLLSTLASLVAIVVERLHYVEVAQAAQLETASERLRSSILSALSHDVRTPLTVLVGLAESLTLAKTALPAASLETAQAIREHALGLSSLVGNLLDLARLHAGRVRLRKEWQPLEEVVGASLQILGSGLHAHRIQTDLAANLPLLEFDAVLMERVLCNLLENAAKYAPAQTTITIQARLADKEVAISVCDEGPGFPRNNERELFDMFVRGEPESAIAGAGLGLAICRAVVEAHAGRINAVNREGGGACVSFTLPLGVPPSVCLEPDLDKREDA